MRYVHDSCRRFAGVLLFLTIIPENVAHSQARAVEFVDVAVEAGVDFLYTFGDYNYENILESSGSGVTILDFDGDGWMDIYMLNGTWLDGISEPAGKVFANTPDRLYRNNGDGTFTEMAAQAGIDDRNWSMAAGPFDYDNDGDTDIYLLNYGPNKFFENNGDGTFTEIAGKLGLQGKPELNGFKKWSVSVAFWDFNLDERLDLMVGNFLAFDPSYKSATTPDMMPHPSEYDGQPSFLYQQMPDGTFKDVTQEMGLYYPRSMCMGLTVFDYEEDGDLDLFQGNDHQENFLFRNNSNGTFTEVALKAGVAVNDKGIPTGSMHGSIGDVDGDGLIDLLVTDLRYGALYRNTGNGLFEDITSRSGVATVFSGKGEWGAILFDYDNDGDLDIFSANGTAEELILQPQLLLENDGHGNFRDIGRQLGAYFREKRSGRGAAAVDYDNDGDLDLVVSHIDLKASASLLRNNNRTGNHWLGISLKGKKGPVSVIAAKVVVHLGDKQIVRINQPGNTYLSYNDPRIHFGLGNVAQVDLLEVYWTDGSVDRIRNVKPDRYITIVQGNGIKN
jgi:hypothetical protein